MSHSQFHSIELFILRPLPPSSNTTLSLTKRRKQLHYYHQGPRGCRALRSPWPVLSTGDRLYLRPPSSLERERETHHHLVCGLHPLCVFRTVMRLKHKKDIRPNRKKNTL